MYFFNKVINRKKEEEDFEVALIFFPIFRVLEMASEGRVREKYSRSEGRQVGGVTNVKGEEVKEIRVGELGEVRRMK